MTQEMYEKIIMNRILARMPEVESTPYERWIERRMFSRDKDTREVHIEVHNEEVEVEVEYSIQGE